MLFETEILINSNFIHIPAAQVQYRLVQIDYIIIRNYLSLRNRNLAELPDG